MQDTAHHPYNGKTPFVVVFMGWFASFAGIGTFSLYLFHAQGIFTAFTTDGRGAGLPDAALWSMTAMAACWALLPPIWFWYEYWGIYLRQPRSERGDPGAFAHGQQVSAAIWAALVVVQFSVLTAVF